MAATLEEIAELRGFLGPGGIPESATHSCNVTNCTKLSNGRGWSCERPDPSKCITGRDKFVKASAAIAVINEKVAEVTTKLGAAAQTHSEASAASAARITQLEGQVRDISERERQSNVEQAAAKRQVDEALAEERRLKNEQMALVRERDETLAAQRAAKNAKNANNSRKATAAAESAARALADKNAELEAARGETQAARDELAAASARATGLDRELALVIEARDDATTRGEAANEASRGVIAELVKAYDKLKAAHIANLDRKLAQIENYKTGKVIVRTVEDTELLNRQKATIQAQKAAITGLANGADLSNAAPVLTQIDGLESQLQAMQNEENADYGRAPMAGGKRKTRRHKVSKRKQTKKHHLRKRK